MGLPQINIIFKSKAIKAIQQGAVGIVALVLKDESVEELTHLKILDVADIPDTLSETNIEYLNQCFMGTPKEVNAVVIPDSSSGSEGEDGSPGSSSSTDAANYNEALNYLETIQWNIGAIPGIASGDAATVASWVKSMRDNKDRKVLFVLPNTAADHEGVINFTTSDIVVGENTYTASEYTARIAGLIAGLSLRVAPTYQVLPEVDDVPKLTRTEADAKIDDGEFILYHDGEKVKVGRGVTSLVTTTEDKGEVWKKIKLVRIYDKVYTDIRGTFEDEYIGKVQNSYENKLLLCAAVNAYYEVLEQEGLLDPGKSRLDINVAAQKTYLKSIGEPVDDWNEQQIKEANTRDKVFVAGPMRALDAIEDIAMVINL